MFEGLLGHVVSGIGNLVGGFMNQGSQQGAAANQWAMANQQYNNQKEFAQNAIQWRAADAKAAGIHPLYALGGAGAGYSPSTFYDGGGSSGLGAGMAAMGQDLGRAIASTQTKEERELNELQKAQIIESQARVRESEARIGLIAAQTAKMAGQVGPPMPEAVSSPSLGKYEVKPNEVTTSQPSAAGHAAGHAGPTVNWHMDASGTGIQAFPPKSLGVEDELGAPLMADWLMRNRISPNLPGSSSYKPPYSVIQKHFPGATDVRFDVWRQLWVPVYPRLSDGKRRDSEGHILD